MAAKVYNLDGIGEVTVYKRRGTRRLNLRIVSGKIRVTQPTWLPYAAGVQFATTNQAWIAKQRIKQPSVSLDDGMQIGKHHILNISPGAEQLRTRITDNELIIHLPPHMSVHDLTNQPIVMSAIKRVLKQEAEQELPDRLAYCADIYDFNYTSVHCKSMRSRWGSCNNQKEITLNIFLMMAPWELIDYVLIHELVHTKHLHHGTDFWAAVAAIMPDYKQRRKQLKEIQSQIMHLQ